MYTGVSVMMEERNEFEEYKMNLIAFQGDVICTSPTGTSPESPDPGPEWSPGGGEGPSIEDDLGW